MRLFVAFTALMIITCCSGTRPGATCSAMDTEGAFGVCTDATHALYCEAVGADTGAWLEFSCLAGCGTSGETACNFAASLAGEPCPCRTIGAHAGGGVCTSPGVRLECAVAVTGTSTSGERCAFAARPDAGPCH